MRAVSPKRFTRSIFGIVMWYAPPAHRHGDVQAARAHREHADAAAGRRVAVRADQRLAGLAKAL